MHEAVTALLQLESRHNSGQVSSMGQSVRALSLCASVLVVPFLAARCRASASRPHALGPKQLAAQPLAAAALNASSSHLPLLLCPHPDGNPV